MDHVQLSIGKNSDGTSHTINIDAHIFVSHSDVAQLFNLFNNLLQSQKRNLGFKIYGCFNDTVNLNPDVQFLINDAFFIKKNPENSFVKSQAAFIATICKEIRIREKQPTKKYGTLVVLVESIWEWVMLGGNKKTVARQILEVFSKGAANHVFCFFGSGLPYRNLLPQLLQNAGGAEVLADGLLAQDGIKSIGHHLVYNPEGITYIQEKGSHRFVGLY